MSPRVATPRADLIGDSSGLDAISDEWRRLAEARGNAFVTPEWFFAWLRHYGDESEAAVTVTRDADGALLGLMPLVVSTSGRPRVIRFAGSGLGDHFHPVAEPSAEEIVAATSAEALANSPRPWSTIVLENVEDGNAWCGELARGSGTPLAVSRQRRAALPYAELAGRDWNGYLADRSRGFRNQVGRKQRSLEREHEVRFRRATEPSRVADEVETLFRLHDARWRERSGTSSLRSERARAFHMEFAAAAQQRGWLRLWFLELDGEPVAAWYGWRVGCRYSYYQAGFDPAWASHSVGFLLMARAIRDAIEEGAAEFDLLLGEEGFKSRFADRARSVSTLVIVRARHPARLLVATESGLRRAARGLPSGARGRVRSISRALLARLPAVRQR